VNVQQSLRRHLVIGVASVAVLMFIVFGWGTLSEISGAVIAPGKLVVDSNVKKVQHPTGGVVGDLRVKDGDRVKKGDIVVRLDETQARTSLAIVTKALDEMEARQARLEAERDGADKVTFPDALVARRNEPEVSRRWRASSGCSSCAARRARARRRSSSSRSTSSASRSSATTSRWRPSPRRSTGTSRSWAASAACGSRTWCRSTA
jgi:multidrug efflux pump subunit AcrA (membrane-fusion protein)